MKQNRVKKTIKEGRIATNSYFYISDPVAVELIAIAGYDAVTIDLESGTFDNATVKNLIIAADGAGITPIVRIPPGDWASAGRFLDAGAQGIQVTRVADRRTAEEAVEAVRYRPLGMRGAMGNSRAASYGTRPWDEHVARSNEEILLILMIEDAEGLRNLPEIASVPGVDLIVMGLHDLSYSLGVSHGDRSKLKEMVFEAASVVNRTGNCRFGLNIGAVPLTVEEAHGIGVVYSTLSNTIERQLVDKLKENIRKFRSEEDSCISRNSKAGATGV